MKRALLVVLFLTALGGLAALEVRGRAVPANEAWVDDLHPLLGAAPPRSFARVPDQDPLEDFQGRPFPRRRPAKERWLLTGGARALALVPELERRLAGKADLVVAARAGFTTTHEALLVARFAPVLDVTGVIAVDGEELAHAPSPRGWTPEWDWREASVASPVGEWLARRSGLARLVFFRTRADDRPPEVREDQYLGGVRLVEALCRARGWRRVWAPDAARPGGLTAAALLDEVAK